MKKYILLLSASLSLSLLSDCPPLSEYTTVKQCNEAITELENERLSLQRETVVRYRKSDHPTKNVDKRLKVVEINREFVNAANTQINFTNLHVPKSRSVVNNHNEKIEWEKYRSMIPSSEKRLARIEEIKKLVVELKKRRFELQKKR